MITNPNHPNFDESVYQDVREKLTQDAGTLTEALGHVDSGILAELVGEMVTLLVGGKTDEATLKAHDIIDAADEEHGFEIAQQIMEGSA